MLFILILRFYTTYFVVIATTEAKTPRSKKKSTPKGGVVNNSVTAVLFQNEYTLLSAGDCDGY